MFNVALTCTAIRNFQKNLSKPIDKKDDKMYNNNEDKERGNIKMNILQVVKVVELLELEYRTEELETNVSYLEVVLGYDNYDEEITKTIYFNPKTGLIIPKYEEKLKIKKQIKELQEELKKLEEI